jgi:hypothetical protein
MEMRDMSISRGKSRVVVCVLTAALCLAPGFGSASGFAFAGAESPAGQGSPEPGSMPIASSSARPDVESREAAVLEFIEDEISGAGGRGDSAGADGSGSSGRHGNSISPSGAGDPGEPEAGSNPGLSSGERGCIIRIAEDAPDDLKSGIDAASAEPDGVIDDVSDERMIYRVDSAVDLRDMLDEGVIDARYIDAIEPDVPIFPDAASLSPFVPDDPLYNLDQKSYAQLIGLPELWALDRRGDPAVTVGVIDSGLRIDHIDMDSDMVFSTPDHNYIRSHDDIDPGDPDYGNESNWTPDNDSHGTFVASIIAAQLDNGLCMAGSQPGVKIVPYKVFDKGRDGNLSDLLAALGDAINEELDVVNMSLGMSEEDISSASKGFLSELCQEAVDSGMLVIAAAGNGGDDTLHYPAAYPQVVGVGSVDKDGIHSAWSQTGENVYVCAPGEDVTGLKHTTNGAVAVSSGTSFASPYVAAAAALAKSLRPEITQSGFMQVLRETSRDMGLSGKDRLYGYGLVDFVDLYYSIGCKLSAQTLRMGVANSNSATLDFEIDEDDVEPGDITWSVSGPAIASLQVAPDGRSAGVTALAPGDTVVTASYDGAFGSSTQTCELTIDEVLAESISLNPGRVTLDLASAETAFLTCDILPVDATIHSVEWSTSNRYVAALDVSSDKRSATVRAGLKGTACVTVNVNGEHVRICEVTVTDSRPRDIAFSKNEMLLDLGAASGAEEYIDIVTLPSSAVVTGAVWTSSDPQVATVTPSGDGRRAKVTGVGPGSANVTVSVSGGFTARCAVKVTEARVQAPPPGGTAVGPVTLKSARPHSYNAVKLTWTAAAGADSYTIFYKSAGAREWEQLRKPGAMTLSAVVSRLKTGSKYQFKVCAANDAGVNGAMSSALSAKPALAKPNGLALKKRGKSSVRLRWGKVPGASGYAVYQKSGAGPWKKVASTKKRSLVKKGLARDTGYKYRVRAWRNQDGKKVYGPYSSTVKR